MDEINRPLSIEEATGLPEAEVLSIIERVVNILVGKCRYGYHTADDIKQDGRFFALKCLQSGKYDRTRPLANFLYVHVRNRLVNDKRNTFFRKEPPCYTCIFYDPRCEKSTNQCAVYKDKDDCKKLTNWKIRNMAKKSLMQPVDISLISAGSSSHKSVNLDNQLDFSSLKDLIDKELPVELRADYLRMLGGERVAKPRKNKVRKAVLKILEGRNNGQGDKRQEDET